MSASIGQRAGSATPRAFLYYWMIYWDDLDESHWPLSKLNQNSRTMQRIRPGDVVWAFTRRRTDGAYVLVARFLVSHVGENDDGTPAGRWYFASDTGNFRYLDPQTQKDAEPVIRRLEIRADATVLGNSFQGGNAVREISIEALQALDRHASHLLKIPDISEIVRRASQPSRANGGGGGESDRHRDLKTFVAQNPICIGLPGATLPGTIEENLPSGDCLDVSFKVGDEWVAAEVKSSLSSPADVTRGLFQCVKYHAVMAAVQTLKGHPSKARAVLVLEGKLSQELIPLRNILGVEVFEEVSPKLPDDTARQP